MTLAHPWALLLAGLSLAAAAWDAWRARSRRTALPFPAAASVEVSSRAKAARRVESALKGLALVLLALGLARPQRLNRRWPGQGQGIDIMLAVDTSLSMSALDFAPSNRLDAAKDTARRFILGRVQDRIGLLTFGGASLLLCPLTLDYDALLSQLAALQPGMTRADGTAIGDGIISGVNRLKEGDGKSKVLILLTDGRSNTGLIDPLTAAKTAAAYGVKVYAIGTAQRGPAIMPVDDPVHGRVMVRIDDDLDEELLSQIADMTGGRYFRATSLKELRDVYATIDRLEKSAVKLPDLVSRDDRYLWPVAAAILVLLLETAAGQWWLLRWP